MVFRVVASEPGGFDNIDTVQIALVLHSVVLDEILFDRVHNTISTPSSLAVPVGSRFDVPGTFFSLTGRGVDVNTSGDRLAITVRARMVHDVARGAQFSLGAIDSVNRVARVTRAVRVPQPKSGGFSWSTLLLAVFAAMFAGGFVGNLFSTRRRGAVAPGIYEVMQRRINEERAA